MAVGGAASAAMSVPLSFRAAERSSCCQSSRALRPETNGAGHAHARGDRTGACSRGRAWSLRLEPAPARGVHGRSSGSRSKRAPAGIGSCLRAAPVREPGGSGATATRGTAARYPGRYDALLVESDVFTPDTPINRAIKAGVGQIARLTQTPGTLALCRELLARLDAVGDRSPSAVGPAFDSLCLDRRSVRLQSLVEVLALVVRDRGSAAAASPEAPGPAWLFSMDRLWERFVGQRLRQLLSGLEVTEQGPARSLMTSGVFLMRPDIVVTAAGRVRMVLDTKWKVFAGPSDVDVADLRRALTPTPASIMRASQQYCYTRPGPTDLHP